MKHTQNSKVQKVIISLMSFFFGHIEVFVPIQVFFFLKIFKIFWGYETSKCKHIIILQIIVMSLVT